MKIIGAIIVFIFTLVFAIIGGLLVAFSFNLLTVQNMAEFLQQIIQIQNIHLNFDKKSVDSGAFY